MKEIIAIDIREMMGDSSITNITLGDYIAHVAKEITKNCSIPTTFHNCVTYRPTDGSFDINLIPRRDRVQSIHLSNSGYTLMLELNLYKDPRRMR